MQRDLLKDKNERENLCIKRNKIITKIHNLVNIGETNKTEKQIVEIEKSKDDLSRISKPIKDSNKMKPNTPLFIKEENQYAANKKQRVKLIAKHFQIIINKD